MGFGDVIAGSAEISTGSGKVQIGEVEGTAARLAVNTGHRYVRNLLESAARPGEADETVEVRGHASYGDVTIHRS